MPQTYIARVADGELAARMATSGAVLVEGPKACGKSRTAARLATTVVRLDVDPSARELVSSAPEVLFGEPAPIVFDEWQVAPTLWNLVRREVDDRAPLRGQFILTGSATPRDDVDRHPGAGRMSLLRMRPMSLFESGHSTGAVSLQALFDDAFTPARDPGLSVPQVLERLVIGGWPYLADADVASARHWVRDYLTTVVADVQQVDGHRSPQHLARLLRSLGRSVGTDASITSLAADVAGADSRVDRDTISRYLTALERLMLVEDVPAWAPHMRSTTPLRKSAFRYMTDPSLAVGALRAGPDQLLADLNATGLQFEGLVARDLRVYAQPLDGALAHWRDANGHEVDFIVTLADGRWGALEVKMNPDDIDGAASSLLRFAGKVDTSRVGAPAFLGVVTTRTAALRRPDGVLTLPIGALGP